MVSVALLVAFAAPACSHDSYATSTTPAQTPSNGFDVSITPTNIVLPGGWTGRTSQGSPAGLLFSGSQVMMFAFGVKGETADCQSFFGAISSSVTNAPVVDGAFGFRISSPTVSQGSKYSFDVLGTLSSDTASGTLVGSIIDLPSVSRCLEIPVNVTWTVTKPK